MHYLATLSLIVVDWLLVAETNHTGVDGTLAETAQRGSVLIDSFRHQSTQNMGDQKNDADEDNFKICAHPPAWDLRGIR